MKKQAEKKRTPVPSVTNEQLQALSRTLGELFDGNYVLVFSRDGGDVTEVVTRLKDADVVSVLMRAMGDFAAGVAETTKTWDA